MIDPEPEFDFGTTPQPDDQSAATRLTELGIEIVYLASPQAAHAAATRLTRTARAVGFDIETAKLGDHILAAVPILRDDFAQFLWIDFGRKFRRTYQIAEHDRQLARFPFLNDRGRLQRGSVIIGRRETCDRFQQSLAMSQ